MWVATGLAVETRAVTLYNIERYGLAHRHVASAIKNTKLHVMLDSNILVLRLSFHIAPCHPKFR